MLGSLLWITTSLVRKMLLWCNLWLNSFGSFFLKLLDWNFILLYLILIWDIIKESIIKLNTIINWFKVFSYLIVWVLKNKLAFADLNITFRSWHCSGRCIRFYFMGEKLELVWIFIKCKWICAIHYIELVLSLREWTKRSH